MLHHILVKWNPTVEKQAAVQAVRVLYAEATAISGVNRVDIRENVTPRENRYDLMIVLDMDDDALPIWDKSSLHQKWKTEFGSRIEKKCIFDCESV